MQPWPPSRDAVVGRRHTLSLQSSPANRLRLTSSRRRCPPPARSGSSPRRSPHSSPAVRCALPLSVRRGVHVDATSTVPGPHGRPVNGPAPASLPDRPRAIGLWTCSAPSASCRPQSDRPRAVGLWTPLGHSAFRSWAAPSSAGLLSPGYRPPAHRPLGPSAIPLSRADRPWADPFGPSAQLLRPRPFKSLGLPLAAQNKV